jgi:hypothetical protein
MAATPDFEEILEGVVFRLANVTNDFPQDASKPLPSHFEPSTADKERSLALGHPVLLSVFDRSRTTVAEAEALRTTKKATAAFGLEVARVRELGVPERPRAFRVLRDPLEAPQSEAPGADGHCGIEGLHRPTGESRRLYRALRSQVADLAFRLA